LEKKIEEPMLKARYCRIIWFFGKVILNIIWWDIILFRLGLRAWSRSTRKSRLQRSAKEFRLLAVRMGGVLIKVGQFLSARVDILPREVTDELAGLQDEVAEETFVSMRRVVEAEFGCALEERFSEFDPLPLASASIGQVHRARLRRSDDKDDAVEMAQVVVKVQRPGIEQIIKVDLSALRVVVRWVQLYPPIRKRANIPALLEELSRSIHEEIDYLQEGKNAEIFGENFQGDDTVLVPSVFWSHTTRRVLTLEDVLGIKISDYSAIETAGIKRHDVAERLLDTFLKQIFDDRFFHADPHPGNLFVLPLGGEPDSAIKSWKLVFVDFGMVGRLTTTMFAGLREMLVGVGTRDAGRVVKAYQMLDVLLPGADLDLIQRAEERAFERFWGKTAPELVQMHMAGTEVRQFVQDFGDLLYEMPFQVPEDMILFGRCMAILSGICTGLDHEFNFFTQLEPYARKLVAAEGGSSMNFWLTEIGAVLSALVGLPKKAETLLNRIEQGRLEIRDPEIKIQLSHLDRSVRRLTGAVIFGVLFFTAIQLYLGGMILGATGAGVAAGGVLIWMLALR
jgi:predicted unusual protein kinase regulating ubiquinone biosynthesis (AarF/ABC1/UbiB family)